jgi:hypothetical protein
MTLARPELVVGLAGGVSDGADVEAAGVAQGVLLLEVPARRRLREGPSAMPLAQPLTTCDEATIAPLAGSPGTETPYSVSMPITRRTLMRSA